MTQTTTTTRTTRATKADAEKVLRDMAFALSMTRRVRDEILSELPPRVIGRTASLPAVAAEVEYTA